MRPEKRIQLILFTVDRGLAGAFNANLIKAAQQVHRRTARTRKSELKLIGRKGRDFFRRRKAHLPASISASLERPRYEDALEIARQSDRAISERRN